MPCQRHGNERPCKACMALWRGPNAGKKARLAYFARNPQKVAECRERWKAKNMHKHLAHGRVRYALKAGKLTKPSHCQLCWQQHTKIQGHHQDYSLPLEVVWLCEPCHQLIEGRQPR